jgi:hypothetical protein
MPSEVLLICEVNRLLRRNLKPDPRLADWMSRRTGRLRPHQENQSLSRLRECGFPDALATSGLSGQSAPTTGEAVPVHETREVDH